MRSFTCTKSLVVGLLLPWVVTSAFADCEPGKPADNNETQMSIALENDMFSTRLGLGDSDKWYTNGVKVTLTFDENTDVLPSRLMCNAVDKLAQVLNMDDSVEHRYGIALGQLIFTPQNIVTPLEQPNDRFYGGWLYAGGVVQFQREDRIKTVELDIGLTGPPSLAEGVQKLIHRTFNFDKPEGWSHQIKTEPGIQISYNSIANIWGNDSFDASRYWGATAGTVFDNAKAGLIFRYGDLTGGAPAAVIESPVIGSQLKTSGWYLLARGEAEGVLHNTFIDGSLFRDDPFSTHTDKRPLVGQLTLGIVKEGILGNRAKISFLLNRRTQEFTSPTVHKGQMFTFGTLSVEFPI